MTTAIAPIRRKLVEIDSRTWEHPADRAALSALRAIPGFDEVLKKMFGMFGERGTRLAFRANAVRVGPKQFPRMHTLWLGVLDTLDAQEEYELYIAQTPEVNAGAYGLDRPWVLLLSGSLRLLDDDEISSIMGHELGHVLSGHALYHTMLELLLRLVASNVPGFGIVVLPILYALKEWYRKSELSADRAGLLACQQAGPSLSALMRLAGGGLRNEMDLNAFLQQADEYRNADNIVDQVLKILNTLGMTHPFLVMRAAQLRDWIEDGSYDRIVRGEYPRRSDPKPPWSEDAGAAFRHYAGGSPQDAAEKAGDAIRKMRDAFDRGFRSGE